MAQERIGGSWVSEEDFLKEIDDLAVFFPEKADQCRYYEFLFRLYLMGGTAGMQATMKIVESGQVPTKPEPTIISRHLYEKVEQLRD